MELFKSIIEWITACAATSLIAILAKQWKVQRERANAADAEESARDKDLTNNVTDWLKPALFALVTQAEREFGSGSGRLKMATVVAQAVALLPDEIKGRVDADWLAARVEAALAMARQAWAENPKVLGELLCMTEECVTKRDE